jgi:DNA-binding NtrC family response regulator
MPLAAARMFSAGGHRWLRLPAASTACRHLEISIRRLAQVGSTTLITGETGSGKGEVARAIHAAGPRREAPFVPVNCGGLPASLAESQLFGHERGSFTGASGATRGAFRAADGGVLFLDEIAELPLELQPILLDVLERREVTPVGSTRQVPIDVHVIAATNRNLQTEVAEGRFREDLLFRLTTVALEVPPLRDRPDDIPRFIAHFSAYFAARYDQPAWEPQPATLRRLITFPWPGNVRQLAQAVERHYIFGGDEERLLQSLSADSEPAAACPGDSEAEARPLSATADCPEQSTRSEALRDAAAQPAGSAARRATAAASHAETELPTFNLREVRNRTVRAAMAAAGNHFGKAAALLGVSPNTLTKLVAEACPELSRKKRAAHSKRHAFSVAPAVPR